MGVDGSGSYIVVFHPCLFSLTCHAIARSTGSIVLLVQRFCARFPCCIWKAVATSELSLLGICLQNASKAFPAWFSYATTTSQESPKGRLSHCTASIDTPRPMQTPCSKHARDTDTRTHMKALQTLEGGGTSKPNANDDAINCSRSSIVFSQVRAGNEVPKG